jgi:hypothetical protein
MKVLLLLFSLLLPLAHAPADGGGKASHSKRRATLPKLPAPLSYLGRCSGDAYCTACSSCEYCGHCAGGGGTCGVCASYSAPVRRVSRTVRPSYRVSSGSRGSGGRTAKSSGASQRPTTTQLDTGLAYYVAAETLNLRAEPSADAEVVRVLTRNDIVTVLELTDAKWAQVRVVTDEGDVVGYVVRAYLSEQESR